MSKKVRIKDIAETERQIAAFFSYLDNRPYIRSLNLAGGSYLQYQIAIEKLSAKPPIIVGEMDSLYNMVRNIVGTLIDIGRGYLAPGSMKNILKAKDRTKAGPTGHRRLAGRA